LARRQDRPLVLEIVRGLVSGQDPSYLRADTGRHGGDRCQRHQSRRWRGASAAAVSMSRPPPTWRRSSPRHWTPRPRPWSWHQYAAESRSL